MIIVLAIGKPKYESMVDICLTARALGASSVVLTSSSHEMNSKLKRFCNSVTNRWGGNFSVQFVSNWKSYISTKTNYKTVYLTRYGIPIQKQQYSIRSYKNILLIISTDKERPELNKISDFNISITAQPHSSIASMAIFLNMYYAGRELSLNFSKAQYKVVPSQHDSILKER